MSAKKSILGIDLFCGAGGMSLGAEACGIDISCAVDIDRFASATYKANHTDVDVRTCDIATVKNLMPPNARRSPVIVFGGPPCQGFSTSNQRTRTRENPINWLFAQYLRVVNEVQPDWVVFENVKGLLETEKGFFLEAVMEALAKSGYTVSSWVLNAADFGVPQRRWRLFLVASLHGISLVKPSPTVTKAVTVREAISDLPVLRNGASRDVLPYRKTALSSYAASMRGSLVASSNHLVTSSNATILERYRSIPTGGNWQHIPDELMSNYADPKRCHTGIYKRLRPDEPSIVIGNFRKNMLIHPTQTRGLSVREAARLQSFPDSFKFLGSIGFQQQQVGNAVPPLLARAVFTQIVERL